MRLSETERALIKEAVAACLGAQARVLLFGSRTDDSRRGRFHQQVNVAAAPLADALGMELKLAAALQARLGERRVDVLLHQQGQAMSPMAALAAATGVPL
jgi:hypothetical protein